jgi:2-polyprenyl-6-methoxyphenol hydroxylase-like FAD-dependent oxidoreductase
LKTKCIAQRSIETHFGWKYTTHAETSDGVDSTFIDTEGKGHVVHSQYLVGADGGSSSVRKTAGIKMFGAPM